MNTKPEVPALENATPDDAPADANAPAKTTRRRRTSKPAADAAARPGDAGSEAATTPSIEGSADGERSPDPVADAAAAPKRRRRKPVETPVTDAPDVVAADAATRDATQGRLFDPDGAPGRVPADAGPTTAAVASPSGPASDDTGPVGMATEGGPAAVARGDDNGPAAGVEAGDAQDGGDEPRRRRNRRDRRRGGRRDAEGTGAEATGEAGTNASPPGAQEPADADGDAAALPVAVLPKDAGEVFEQVLSGRYDAEDPESEDETPPPASASKRVLQADIDAPKLQKVLAQSGVGSRRDMEALIVEGKITVNGEPAHVGQRISFGDRIQVNGKPIKVRISPPAPRVVAYHKPVGEIVTHDDPQQRPTVFRKLPRLQQGKWLSVGRLDINTEGLLLFTNSGELANQLMHPRFGLEREYAVRVLGTLDDIQREDLLEGVAVDGHDANFLSIDDGGGEGANHWYRVVIAEGRNREVRKMFDAVGLTVSRLIRIRYGNVVLPRGLKRGAWIDLDEQDVRAIRRLAGGDGQRPGQKPAPGQGKRNKRGGGNRPQAPQPQAGRERERDRDRDNEFANIPNPLEQTFDRRFVQKQRPFPGGFGNAKSSQPKKGGPGGAGGGAGGQRQPDPMQTSVGYIGADGFHRRGGRGGGGGGGGGNRGGGGGFGGFGRGGRGR